jgi:small-conductance mechanosensitive channel
VLEQPGPGVSLLRFSPEGYELELGFWIADPQNGRGGVVSEVNKKLFALVKSGEIKLAHLPKEPTLSNAQIVALIGELRSGQ